MAQNMKGKVVALACSRKAAEMGTLVEKMGGTPRHRPSQGTVFLDDEKLREGILSWTDNPPQWVILTTGIGLDTIFEMAERMGLAEKFHEVLSQSSIAARGYKTVNALRKRNLTPLVRDDDGSTAGLIRSFEPYDLKGASVIVQLHGDPAPKLMEWLEEQEAYARQLLPYRHVPPEQEQLEQLVADIVGTKVDAVTFTSAPQFRFLAEYAREQGQLPLLIEAFAGPVVAVAVGKITAQALKEEGIERIVIPEEERMGSMMVELGRFFLAQSEVATTTQDQE
ncbi:uroporphyrinogen-III synthase [Paenibacillus sp. IHBB 10380]|uniref:uroporphyrinogen-III synthase n=1 Tax=Paenibacillus sp. IHBB 10380 TaxID=1566358 RepID=UPI0005CFA854|nr:uroporphyrinogen-III synthase [Paenibacillus sp. IHBB 10380]AJS60455.1 uroporphyrinogen-III synthase [Paenibacillus sp. IHBB 10380]